MNKFCFTECENENSLKSIDNQETEASKLLYTLDQKDDRLISYKESV